MGRIEKTVFISYRRTNLPWALFVYQNLTMHGFDVFFDYESIDSGNFENAILDNIRARAHFVIILTPSALERCKNPDDWLRREIETALDEKRNIVPLLIEGFDYGSPLVQESLTGKLATLSLINGLPVPNAYALEAMNRLRERYLNKALSDVALPTLRTDGEKITGIQKTAANEAPPVSEEQLSAQTWFERGYVFQNDKNLDEALRCYSESIRLDPTFSAAYLFTGNVLNNLERYSEAETAYRKAVELKPDDANIHCLLGNLLQDLKRNDEAEAAYRKAIELNPNNANAYYDLGDLLRNLKRYDEAEAAYRKKIELNPSEANTHLFLGTILKNLDRIDEAETAYHKAIELNPNDATYYYFLGNLLRELERNDEAEAVYRKAIELNPDYVAYSNLGILLNDLKRYEEAEAAYRKAIELKPTDIETLYVLGRHLADANIKRFNEAEEIFYKLLDLDANHKDTLYCLACIRSLNQDTELAFVYLEKAITAGFDKSWAWEDPDLQWIRDDPRFVQIVGERPSTNESHE